MVDVSYVCNLQNLHLSTKEGPGFPWTALQENLPHKGVSLALLPGGPWLTPQLASSRGEPRGTREQLGL